VYFPLRPAPPSYKLKHISVLKGTTFQKLNAFPSSSGDIYSVGSVRKSEPQSLGLRKSEPQSLGLRKSEPQSLGLRKSEPQSLSLRKSEPQSLGLRKSEPQSQDF
jgi:hypothetical protein